MAKRIIKFDESKEKSTREMISEFLDFKATQGCAALTLRDYEKTFRQWERFDYNFMEFLRTRTGSSPAKFNIPYSNINALFNWCVKQDYIKCNPLIKAGLKKVRDDGRIRAASINDIQKLLKAIDMSTYVGLRDNAIIMLMLDTGIRPKEIFSLTVKDFDNDIITIRKDVAKTRQKRVVPLTKVVSIQISKIIALKPKEWQTDLIFCSYDGLQMHGSMFDKRLQIYSEKAKVKITPYDLRHTFATMYLNNQGNVFSLQRIMGHSDLRMTKRYIAITDRQLIEQHKLTSPIHNILTVTKRLDRVRT